MRSAGASEGFLGLDEYQNVMKEYYRFTSRELPKVWSDYDYELLASNLSSYADFISINVSSPNTPGLRNFQSEKSLIDVINSVYKGLKNEKAKKIDIPVFIKISPDLKIQDLENIINVAIKKNVTPNPIYTIEPMPLS